MNKDCRGREPSMKWENLAILELAYYKNKEKHLQKIDDWLEEIESELYSFPVSYFDEESGEFKISGSNLENQVIKKLETEDGLFKLKNRIKKRCERVDFAIDRLEKYEKELITSIFLSDLKTEKIPRNKLRQTLRKLYRFILIQKYELRKEKAQKYQQDKIARVKKALGIINDQH